MSASIRTNTSAADAGYADWLRELDQICRRRLGLSAHDLPDMERRKAYDADVAAKEFFHATLVPRLREEHGTFVDELLSEIGETDEADPAPEAA